MQLSQLEARLFPKSSPLWDSAHVPMEVTMERYIHNANIEHYRHLLAESERDPARDQDRHATLLTLLAEEIAKDKKPRS